MAIKVALRKEHASVNSPATKYLKYRLKKGKGPGVKRITNSEQRTQDRYVSDEQQHCNSVIRADTLIETLLLTWFSKASVID
uniref:Uncharacterized protein n=1 Tax=Oryza nivara TaxID=4536 RepID=A0A0E0H8F1_ORYNI